MASPTAVAASAEGTGATPTASSSAAQSYTVARATAALGMFLTGEGGKTLYTLKTDGPNKTTCTGGCASSWPPFTLGSAETAIAGAGVSGKLGTFVRPDGTTQVTYNGIPLYYFAGDTKAGDTIGQGAGGVWFVARPDGLIPSSAPIPKITPAPTAAATRHPTPNPTPAPTPNPTPLPTPYSPPPYPYPSY